MHLNIRSTIKNLEKLEGYLENINHTFKIIGLSETLLTKENNECYSLLNYNHELNTRQNKRGGGVSFYLHNTITQRRPECAYKRIDRFREAKVYCSISKSFYAKLSRDLLNASRRINFSPKAS